MFMMLLLVQLNCFVMLPLLSYCCQVWAFCALTPVVFNLCLILRCVCVCVCVCVFACLRVRVFAARLCSRAKRRERRVWYASLTSFSPHHQSALSFLSCLFSTHSSQQIHAHLLWQENQSKCFDTDSVCDPQLIIYVIWSTHLWQASQLPNTKHSALNSGVLSV